MFLSGISESLRLVKADMPGRIDIISKELTEIIVSYAGIPRYRENVWKYVRAVEDTEIGWYRGFYSSLSAVAGRDFLVVVHRMEEAL